MSIHQRFNKLTSINFSYIESDGKIFGGSYNISLEITSSRTIQPKVLENILIEHDNLVFMQMDRNNIIYTDYHNAYINTPALADLKLPREIVKVINLGNQRLGEYLANYFELVIKSALNLGIVNCILDTSIESAIGYNIIVAGKVKLVYDYTHGSLSWLEAELDSFYSSSCSDCQAAINLLESIVLEIDNSVILSNKTHHKFQSNINKRIILDTQATPENLLKYYVQKHKEILIRGHIKSVSLSNGLRHQIVYNLSF